MAFSSGQPRAALAVVLLLSFSILTNAQGENTCTSTSTTVSNTFVGPSKVLYIIVGEGYTSDMLRGYDWLVSAAAKWANNTGSYVDLFRLRTDVNAPLTQDLSVYNQIWVVDLSSTADVNSWQLDAYKKVADWWRARGQPHTILDARIISSMWIAKPHNLANNDKTKDILLVENYFVNLRIRGGGLFLGTDHNVFQSGIGKINEHMGISAFCCVFFKEPYKMKVDISSPLLSYPNMAYYDNGDDVLVPKYWIWDDSSTGNVPYNTQNNGQVYYTVGWHYEQGVLDPGVSSTIRGAVGFLATIVTPYCHQRFNQSDTISFTSNIPSNAAGNPPYVYKWSSNVDGLLSTSASFTRSTLSVGPHVITLRVVDSTKFVAEATVSITIMTYPIQPNGTVISWNGEKDIQVVWPIRRPKSPSAYYNYANNRANTPDSLETSQSRSGQIFFYDDGTDLYIAHLFGNPLDASGGKAAFNISFTELTNIAGSIVTRDPPTSTNYNWNNAAGRGSAVLQWAPGATAGFVAGPLPKNYEYCIIYTFDKSVEKDVDYYIVRSHSDGSFSNPNPNPIVSYRSKAIETQTLSVCWRQFRCGTNSPFYDAPSDLVTNSIVQFAYDGSLFNYTDFSNCTWTVTPVTGSSLPIYAIWVRWPRWSQKANDLVIVRNGTASDSPVLLNYNSGTQPARSVFSHAQSLRFESSPNRDGLTSSGFTAEYFVVPTALGVNPVSGPFQEATTVILSGAHFYQKIVNGVVRNIPQCRVDGIQVSGTFIAHDTIRCVFPARPAGPKADVPVEVSNEGVEWSNSITWSWIDASCNEFTHCGSCLADITKNCRWCNDGSLCYPAGAPISCPAAEIDSTCCTKCQPHLGCSGTNGQCLCNNTCQCNDLFRDSDCACRKCPVNQKTQTMCGHSDDLATTESLGDCACNGTCQCAFGSWGPACECKTCPYSGGLECGGKGTCLCNGTCSCVDTHKGDACECPKTCPGDDPVNGTTCSGHGSCDCGVCRCEAPWRLVDDCSCRETSILNCAGRGLAQCDGSCSCFAGYSGPDCSNVTTCAADNCTACFDLGPDCGWCPELGQCENRYLSRRACGKVRPKLEADLPYIKSCPIIVQNLNKDPDVIPTTTIAAAGAVSAIVGAALAAVIAFVLYRRRNMSINEGHNPWIDDIMEGNETVTNPLYEMQGLEGDNPLYTTPAAEVAQAKDS